MNRSPSSQGLPFQPLLGQLWSAPRLLGSAHSLLPIHTSRELHHWIKHKHSQIPSAEGQAASSLQGKESASFSLASFCLQPFSVLFLPDSYNTGYPSQFASKLTKQLIARQALEPTVFDNTAQRTVNESISVWTVNTKKKIPSAMGNKRRINKEERRKKERSMFLQKAFRWHRSPLLSDTSCKLIFWRLQAAWEEPSIKGGQLKCTKASTEPGQEQTKAREQPCSLLTAKHPKPNKLGALTAAFAAEASYKSILVTQVSGPERLYSSCSTSKGLPLIVGRAVGSLRLLNGKCCSALSRGTALVTLQMSCRSHAQLWQQGCKPYLQPHPSTAEGSSPVCLYWDGKAGSHSHTGCSHKTLFPSLGLP